MSVTWFDGVEITVEVAFATNPQAASPTWTDVTAYLVEIPSIRFGRESEFSEFSPATCEVVLKNADRRFDPEYSSGPYYGDLLPMKKIRVQATYDSTTYDLFTGFVQGWPQTYTGVLDSFVTVRCIDGSRFLEQAKLPLSAYEGELVADGAIHYWPMQQAYPILDEIGALNFSKPRATWVEADVGLSEYIGANGLLPTTRDPGQLEPYVYELASLHTVGADGVDAEPLSVECWARVSTRIDSENSLPLAVSVGQDGSSFIDVRVDDQRQLNLTVSSATLNRDYVDVGGPVPPGVWFHLIVTFDASTIDVYVNGQQTFTDSVSVGTGSLPQYTGAAVTARVIEGNANVSGIAHLSVSAQSLTASQASAHYVAAITAFGHPFGERSGARIDRVLDAAGWPSGDRCISTGDTVQGPYRPDRQSAMTYLRQVEVAEDGYVFIDASGDVVLRDRTWQWTQGSAPVFSDDTGAVDYSDIRIDANTVDAIRNKVSATYGPNDAYLFSEDIVSRDLYGPATEALSVPTLTSSVAARGLTAYKLRTMKDPKTRVTSLESNPREQPSVAFPILLPMVIGTRVVIQRSPQSVGTPIVKQFAVQGYEHRMDAEWWTTTLYLSPAASDLDLIVDGDGNVYTVDGFAVHNGPLVPYLTVSDATYGQIGATADNKIPF